MIQAARNGHKEVVKILYQEGEGDKTSTLTADVTCEWLHQTESGSSSHRVMVTLLAASLSLLQSPFVGGQIGARPNQ